MRVASQKKEEARRGDGKGLAEAGKWRKIKVMNNTHFSASTSSKAESRGDTLVDIFERAKRLDEAATHDEVAQVVRDSAGLAVVDLDDEDASACTLDEAKALVLAMLAEEAQEAGLQPEQLVGRWWEQAPA